MADAVLGEDQLSLFVAGAVFYEIWNDTRSAKCCIFQCRIRVVSPKNSLSCWAGCGLRVHARIVVGSWSDRPRTVNDVSAVFTKYLSYFGASFFVASAVFGDVGW